jgi:hypothetical protein
LYCVGKEFAPVKSYHPFRTVFFVLLLSSLPALACGLTGGADGIAELPTVAIEAGTAEVAADAAVPAPAQLVEAPAFPDLETAAASLANFDSYRLDIALTFAGSAGGEPTTGSMRFQTAFVAEPPASQVFVSFEGDLSESVEGVETLTFTEIGDRSYTVLPGFGCMTGSSGGLGGMTDEFDDFADTENILGEIRSADYLGEETIGGVRTFHYRFDESDIDQGGDFDEMEGHIYVAREEGYIVRMVVDGTGRMHLFDEEAMEAGTIHLEYNFTDVNVPILIDPPAECAGAGSEYPVMDGARNLASMAGFTSYEVDASLEDAVAFYDEQLAAQGFSSDGTQTLFEGGAFLTFTQNGATINVTLSEDEGNVSVLLTTMDE